MNITEIVNTAAGKLAASGIENHRNEARWLILEGGGYSALDLAENRTLTAEEIDRLTALVERRCRREPLQYILGNAPFGELELDVTSAVLIPRCETEVLVEKVLELLPPGGTMADVGCGSGAIGLLAAHRRQDIRVTALDISMEALTAAAGNAAKLGLDDRVQFVQSDLLSAVAGEKFDLIAANLPYVTFDEYAALEPEVRCFEPELALTAPDGGMALIFKLISAAPAFLVPGGKIVLEMSPHQTGRACEALQERGMKSSVFADQFGKKRFVCGEILDISIN